jgi:hypothetical protein
VKLIGSPLTVSRSGGGEMVVAVRPVMRAVRP